MATYGQYKDSGVKWLGEIPSHWAVDKIRYFFDEITELNLNRQSSNQLQFKFGTIIPKSDLSVDESVWQTISRYTVVKPNDIIINGLNLNYDLLSHRVGRVRENGVITSAYVHIRPHSDISANYYEYLFKAMDARKVFHSFGTGVRTTLSFKELRLKPIVIPPIDEQKAIVAYLDKVTGEIDRAIEVQQQMIDALNERIQIIISNAVTRGLNPDAPLRDSGIAWLGQIPAHWEIRKIKHICSIFGRIGFRGYTEKDLVNEGEGAITLSPSNIQDGNMNYSKCSYLSWKKYYESPEIMISNGDIIFVKTGSSYGKCALVTDLPMEATINPQSIVMKKFKCSSLFLSHLLKSNMLQKQVSISVIGGTIPTISQEKIKNYFIAFPAIDEQNQIAEYIESATADLKKQLANCQRMIDLLTERKQIIINQVVTGKEKVI